MKLKDTQASYVTISWSPPDNSGGSNIIDYKVEIQRNTEAKPRLYADKVDGLELIVYKLIPAATYSVLVYARNIVGYGDAQLLLVTTKPQGMVFRWWLCPLLIFFLLQVAELQCNLKYFIYTYMLIIQNVPYFIFMLVIIEVYLRRIIQGLISTKKLNLLPEKFLLSKLAECTLGLAIVIA